MKRGFSHEGWKVRVQECFNRKFDYQAKEGETYVRPQVSAEIGKITNPELKRILQDEQFTAANQIVAAMREQGYTHQVRKGVHSFSREGEVFQVEHRLLKAFEQPLSDEQLKSITERFDLTKYEANPAGYRENGLQVKDISFSTYVKDEAQKGEKALKEVAYKVVYDEQNHTTVSFATVRQFAYEHQINLVKSEPTAEAVLKKIKNPELKNLLENYRFTSANQIVVAMKEQGYTHKVRKGAFLDAKDSPKTQSSYLSSLTNSLSTLANEKKVCYVLSGNDFDFNLIDPECPKLVVVSNAYQIENLISPVISLMLSISSRRFTLANKVPFFYFLDEATTFRIADFEKLPSVLREYLCSFVFLTQSAAKIEKIYGKYDRSSIESNFGNQFFGRTKDIEALKSYPLVFGKEERQRVSKTTGSSRGGENRSRTVSTQKEEIYDTNFFTSLKSGEFVGSAAHSNMRNFHLRFEMYEDKEDPLPIVHPVLASDIEENYQQIIRDIQGIE